MRIKPYFKESAKQRGFYFAKIASLIVGGVLLFGAGVGIGSGRIVFGPNAMYRKSVAKDLPADLDYRSVERMYDLLKQSYDGQLTTDALLDGLKQGLAKATGDQYTEYLNTEQSKEFDDDLNGTFSGIGAELGKEEQAIVIVAPIAGYPAEKAGLLPKDAIAQINGENIYDMSVAEAVSKIRGPVGTKVKLKVVRGGAQELDFEITREQITIPSTESQILEGNIGYLKISRFAGDTAGLTEEAVERFRQARVKGVILDLRSNPGGLLDVSVDVASHWLPKGQTVLQEKRDGVVIRTINSKGYDTLRGVPTVVLINEGSASASEITAGALKDNKAATLIGVKTFGKGSVQQLERLADGGVLKVTIARWFTPAGKNIDKEGIEPDQKVERTADDLKNSKDPQKAAAQNFLQKP